MWTIRLLLLLTSVLICWINAYSNIIPVYWKCSFNSIRNQTCNSGFCDSSQNLSGIFFNHFLNLNIYRLLWVSHYTNLIITLNIYLKHVLNILKYSLCFTNKAIWNTSELCTLLCSVYTTYWIARIIQFF